MKIVRLTKTSITALMRAALTRTYDVTNILEVTPNGKALLRQIVDQYGYHPGAAAIEIAWTDKELGDLADYDGISPDLIRPRFHGKKFLGYEKLSAGKWVTL